MRGGRSLLTARGVVVVVVGTPPGLLHVVVNSVEWKQGFSQKSGAFLYLWTQIECVVRCEPSRDVHC